MLAGRGRGSPLYSSVVADSLGRSLPLPQVLQALQTKNLQKLFRRPVKHRPAQGIVPASDADQTLFHQPAQHVAAMDAADGLDVGTHNRLTVGDDGQGFPAGAGERRIVAFEFQPRKPGMELRPG